MLSSALTRDYHNDNIAMSLTKTMVVGISPVRLTHGQLGLPTKVATDLLLFTIYFHLLYLLLFVAYDLRYLCLPFILLCHYSKLVHN